MVPIFTQVMTTTLAHTHTRTPTHAHTHLPVCISDTHTHQKQNSDAGPQRQDKYSNTQMSKIGKLPVTLPMQQNKQLSTVSSNGITFPRASSGFYFSIHLPTVRTDMAVATKQVNLCIN